MVSKLKRKAEQQKRNAENYQKYKEKVKAQRKARYAPSPQNVVSPRTKKKKDRKHSEYEVRKKRQKEKESKKEKAKEKDRHRQKVKYHSAKKTPTVGINSEDGSPFHNKMQLQRAEKKLKEALPKTPAKGKAVLKKILGGKNVGSTTRRKSLLTEGIIMSKEIKEKAEVGEAVIDDVSSLMQTVKRKRSSSAKVVKNVIAAAIAGPSVLKAGTKRKLSVQFGLSEKKLKLASEHREKIIEGDAECCTNTKNSYYSSPITEETKDFVYRHWTTPGISRNLGTNKRQWKRKRIGPSVYLSHERMIMETTQHEAYLDFKERYPEIKLSERAYGALRPFFVTSPTCKDRETCCCKYHVEIRALFTALREFRRKDKERDKELYPDFPNLSDLTEASMCPKEEGAPYHKMECIERRCPECGVDKIKFTDRELDKSDSAAEVQYEDYVSKKIPAGLDSDGNPKFTTKPVLVIQKVKVGEMIEKLKTKLGPFVYHQFRVSWQHAQLEALKEALPQDEIFLIHDFSENAKLILRIETQSGYFDKTEVSIHVTIIYRHAIEEYDGDKSTPEEPVIVIEEMFVISPGGKEAGPHDADAVHAARVEVHKYLKEEVGCTIKKSHEGTDGAASQYRCCHTHGDISCSCQDFGHDVTRNNYETAHARGLQDAAGGLIKREADMAVIRGKVILQSAKDFYDFCVENLTIPKSGKTRRRIFRYVDQIDRNRGRRFKPVPGIQQHRFVASMGNTGKVVVGKLSCYSCDECLKGNYLKCQNSEYTGKREVIKMKLKNTEAEGIEEQEDEPPTVQDLLYKDAVVALDTDPESDYKLLKVTSKGTVRIRKECECQVSGEKYTPGMTVVKGKYYQPIPGQKLTFKLDTKQAVVHASVVSYITFIKAEKQISLNDEEHQVIMDALA